MIYHPISKILIACGIWLFCGALIFEVIYQILTGRIETVRTRSKLKGFTSLPNGNYKIIDKVTKDDLGELSNESLDFLRKRFLEQGMDDNNFYFLAEVMEMFVEKEKPNKELTAFLKKAVKNKNEVELHWDHLESY
jgi:hypothetical protein